MRGEYILNSTGQILCLSSVALICNKKVKAIPLQTWTGPEVSRRLRLQDFKTIGT
jgi:hypothetical protein